MRTLGSFGHGGYAGNETVNEREHSRVYGYRTLNIGSLLVGEPPQTWI